MLLRDKKTARLSTHSPIQAKPYYTNRQIGR